MDIVIIFSLINLLIGLISILIGIFVLSRVAGKLSYVVLFLTLSIAIIFIKNMLLFLGFNESIVMYVMAIIAIFLILLAIINIEKIVRVIDGSLSHES